MTQKTNLTNKPTRLDSMVDLKGDNKKQDDRIEIINGKKYTLVGENKVPTRVEPSRYSTTHV